MFYINFRWRHVEGVKDLVQVLFEVRFGEKEENLKEVLKEFIKEGLKEGARALKKWKGIPIPERVFDYLFKESEKVEDVFRYLESVFEVIAEEGLKPVFILDELQVIKEVVNTAGKPVLSELFNFLVGMTKEKHLVHVFCVTSDCLFMEEISGSARLEGRAEGFLVDDLTQEEAFKAYKSFGFKDKELVWDYIGGKIGDMVLLFERKRQGDSERESLKRMLVEKKTRLLWWKGELMENRSDWEVYWDYLKKFKDVEEVEFSPEEKKLFSYWVERNVLFFDPMRGVIKPQGKLIAQAIKEVV